MTKFIYLDSHLITATCMSYCPLYIITIRFEPVSQRCTHVHHINFIHLAFTIVYISGFSLHYHGLWTNDVEFVFNIVSHISFHCQKYSRLYSSCLHNHPSFPLIVLQTCTQRDIPLWSQQQHTWRLTFKNNSKECKRINR